MMGAYAPLAQAAGQKFNVDPRLIMSVIQTESAGNPNATSPKGAAGLGGIMPATGAAFGVTDPYDPAQNISAIAQTLNQNLSKFGNVSDALRAYNGGWDPSKWSNPETQAYVGKVARAYAAGSSPTGATGQQTAFNGASDVPLTSTAPQQSSAPDAFDQDVAPYLPKSTASGAPSGGAAPPAPDAFDQDVTPYLPGGASAAAPDAPTAPAAKPGFLQNVGAGLEQSISPSGPVFGALNNLTAWGDKNLPGAQAIDNAVGGPSAADNAAISAKVAQGQQAFQQGAGQTLGGQIGNLAGTAALTGPLAEVGGAAVGGTLGAAADALPAGSAVNRLLTAGQTLATGSGAANLGGKVISSATSGALKGAIATTAAGGDPVTGAEYGGALGPVGMAVAPLARGMMLLTGKAAGGVASSLGAPAAEDASSVAGASGASTPNALLNASGSPSVNPLTGETIPGVGQQIPTAFPKPGVIVTQAQADAYADKIIQSFAKGGPTTISDNQLIAGSQPTLAQSTGNAGLATLERGVQAQNPNPFDAQTAANQAARLQVMSGLTGSQADIDAATAARDQMTSAARTAAFANAKPVDAQPVVDQINELIQNNAGRPTVQGPLQQVRNQLVTQVPDPTVDPATGQPTPGAMMDQAISDPATLYNVRKYIGDIVSPKAAGTAQDGRAAAAQLLTLKPVLDDTIESGAPGYTAYIKQFDQLSQPINGMQALQALNLTDAQGNITLAKLDNAVKGLTKQQNAPGARNADSVTPEQMGQLTALRDDMRRQGLSSLGKGIGSNTFQNFASNNLLNAMGSRAGHGIGVAASALGGSAILGPAEGGLGAGVSFAASHIAGGINEKAKSMVMQSLTNKLLNPQAAAAALKKVGP
jgi:hypothetical protein